MKHPPDKEYPRLNTAYHRAIAPTEYEAMFRNPSATLLIPPFSGIVGRLVRVEKDEMPDWLSLPEGRRLAWCMGPDGLRNMIGKSHFQALLGLGIKRDRIQDNLAKGMRWFLVVFPDTGCRLATWDGLFELVKAHFEQVVTNRLLNWRGGLETTPEPIRPETKEKLGKPEVRENPAHDEHMSPQKYADLNGSHDTLENARVFLWHSVGMNNLYTGSGRCRNADGEEGDEEYLAPNGRIDDILGCVVIPLQVTLETSAAGTAGPG